MDRYQLLFPPDGEIMNALNFFLFSSQSVQNVYRGHMVCW